MEVSVKGLIRDIGIRAIELRAMLSSGNWHSGNRNVSSQKVRHEVLKILVKIRKQLLEKGNYSVGAWY
jgi:hypothetical protein